MQPSKQDADDTISRAAAVDALVGITMFKTKHELMQRVNASVQDEQGWLGAVAECLDEIEDLPSAQPEPCEDAVSRADVIDMLEMYPFTEYSEYEAAREVVKRLPSAQPERKNGKWLPDNNSVYEMRFVCSECKESQVVPTIGFTKYKPIWDFCPNCGARMEGE